MSFHKDPCSRANNGAHNTVRQMSTPTTLFGLCHAWKVVKHPSGMSWRYCPVGVQGTVLGIAVDLRALPYLLRLISRVLTKQASPFGCFPVGSDRAGRGRAIIRGLVYFWSEKRVGVGSERRPLLGQAFRSEKRVGVGSEGRPLLSQAFRSERRVRVGSERRPLLGQAFRSETGSLFRPVVRYLGWPRSHALFVMPSAGSSFCWEVGPSGTLRL